MNGKRLRRVWMPPSLLFLFNLVEVFVVEKSVITKLSILTRGFPQYMEQTMNERSLQLLNNENSFLGFSISKIAFILVEENAMLATFLNFNINWRGLFFLMVMSSVFRRVNNFNLPQYYLIYWFLAGCDSKDWNHVGFKQNLAN